MSTTDLLAEHAALMNEHGADSAEVREYVIAHCYDAEFIELAEIARRLKVAFAED